MNSGRARLERRETPTRPSGVAVAGEGDDGEAHPEGLAGGGGAVVGKGVEGDVGVVVKSKVCGGGFGVRAEIEAVGGDALFGECIDEGLLCRGGAEGGGFEKQAGVGDGLQDARPKSEKLGVDLGEGVEGAERDGLGGVAVELHGRGIVGRAVAEEGFGEADEFFGGAFVGAGGGEGVGEGIGEAVIAGVEAGGGGITEIGHLDGRGLAGEGEEAVAGGVAGEVDEDVDLIIVDGAAKRRGRGGRFGAPVVVEGLEPASGGVREGNVGVAEEFDLCGIVVGEEGFDEVADGVGAQVGGAVTDAEAAVGGAVVGVRSEAIGGSCRGFFPRGRRQRAWIGGIGRGRSPWNGACCCGGRDRWGESGGVPGRRRRLLSVRPRSWRPPPIPPRDRRTGGEMARARRNS